MGSWGPDGSGAMAYDDVDDVVSTKSRTSQARMEQRSGQAKAKLANKREGRLEFLRGYQLTTGEATFLRVMASLGNLEKRVSRGLIPQRLLDTGMVSNQTHHNDIFRVTWAGRKWIELHPLNPLRRTGA